MAEIIINKERYECLPAVAAYIKELKTENARFKELYQKLVGVIAATDCAECKDKPVKHGRWIFKEMDELVPTGEFGVAEGHHVHLSAGSTFKPNEKGVVVLKEHKKVKKPFCSECGDHGDDESDATPYCPNCGAKMDLKDGEEK